MTEIPREALRSPACLAHYLTPGDYKLPPHLEYLSDRIASSIAVGNARLLVTMPPQHGKSNLVTRWVHPWLQALWPGNQDAIVSYEARFAAWHGAAARDLVLEHGERLGVEVVNGKDAAAGDWATTAGGRVFSTGIGGPITGRGFDFIGIDDPVKNHKEAASQIIRQSHWDWYETTSRTRVRPGGSMLVVMTRWHPDDLIGRLLEHMKSGGTQWEIIRLPALAESGDVLGRSVDEPLWPERYGFDYLDELRRSSPKMFASMYQGAPRYPEGAMFKREWFKFADEPFPHDAMRVRAWDLASTAPGLSGEPDWTVGFLIARHENSVRIEDVQRFRAGPGDVRKRVRATAEMDGVKVRIKLQQDPGQAGKDQIDSYSAMLFGFVVEAATVTGDKQTRAEPFASAAQLGRVSMVRAPWNAEFLAEADTFPDGKFDDQIDAGSDGFNVLAARGGGWVQALGDAIKAAQARAAGSQSRDQPDHSSDRKPGRRGLPKTARSLYIDTFGG